MLREQEELALQRVEVVMRSTTGVGEEVRVATATADEWIFKLAKEEVDEVTFIRICDEAGNVFKLRS